MPRIKITETVLRDAHQSFFATRLSTEEMLPILEEMDDVGYHALEMWGGATFDACIRFLNEDPWERLREIRKRVKRTPLQMLLRGQNLLGYRHYADDMVEEFVKKSISNGIDIIRIIDAVNDTRNIRKAIETTKKEGAHAQGAISYTKSPIHTNETFINVALEMQEMGADSICIKDMSGISDPYNTFNLIRDMKKKISLPIEYHTHATSGLGSMVYLKAVEAGVDIIDTAISPLGEGSSQPSTEPMVASFAGTEYDTGLDIEKLNGIAKYFRPIRDKYIANGLIDPKLLGVDINTLIYQVPGGMLSNLISQLKEQNAMARFDEVMDEVPRVRAEVGYPPLVTPTSQIVGTQALLNVITGERYKMVTKELKNLLLGMYGRSVAPADEALLERVLAGEEAIDCRPADLLEPELDKIKKEFAKYIQQEEDVLTAAMFPLPAVEFFKYRDAKKYGIDSSLLNEEDGVYPV